MSLFGTLEQGILPVCMAGDCHKTQVDAQSADCTSDNPPPNTFLKSASQQQDQVDRVLDLPQRKALKKSGMVVVSIAVST